jgi:hypothetical protein
MSMVRPRIYGTEAEKKTAVRRRKREQQGPQKADNAVSNSTDSDSAWRDRFQALRQGIDALCDHCQHAREIIDREGWTRVDLSNLITGIETELNLLAG